MAQDTLTFTVRLHDPKEKKDAKLSTSWATVEIPREALSMSRRDFFAKYVSPAIDQLIQLKLTGDAKTVPAPAAPETEPISSLPVDQAAVDAIAQSKP